MLAVVRIALAEFFKAFAFRVGTPSARDFLWLTIFFSLSAFLAFLGYSARDAIWARFEQVLLGALPDSGPPIRVTTHIDRSENISPEIIDKFATSFPGLDLVPMRHVDGAHGAIIMPGMALQPGRDITSLSWEASKNDEEAGFRTYALPLSSPIWQWIGRRSGDPVELNETAPLVVAASRSQFAKYFRYKNYRQAVMNDISIPLALRQELPEQLKDPTALDSLILGVEESQGLYGFHKFKILWIDSFPLPEQIAYILPLSITEMAMAAAARPKINLYTEGRGAPARRVTMLRLKNTDIDNSGVDDFQKIAKCVGAQPPDPNAQRQIIPQLMQYTFQLEVNTPDWPLPIPQVGRCASGTRFAGAVADAVKSVAAESPTEADRSGAPDFQTPDGFEIEFSAKSTPVIWKNFAEVEIPCATQIREDRIEARDQFETQAGYHCQDGDAASRGLGWLEGYRDAMVYVRDPAGRNDKKPPATGVTSPAQAQGTGDGAEAGQSLDQIVQTLLDWRPDTKPVFRLDAAYESALVRFGVLSTIIDLVAVPIGAGMAALYLVLCGVILATAFLHRRAQYGLLFMNGVQPWRLEMLVCLQIALGCLIGCAVAYAAFLGTAHTLNEWLVDSKIMKQAAMVIGLDAPTLLGELTVFHVVAVWLVMTLACIGVGSLVLRMQGISTAKAPIDLIKS